MSFDFASITAPFRMQPGLRRLAPGTPQLTPLVPGDRHLAEKLRVLSSAWPSALVAEPTFDAGPALDALCRHAASTHPQALAFDRHRLQAPHLGGSLDGDGVHGSAEALPGLAHCLDSVPAAWRRAALLALAFAEDFAIVDGASGRVPWLAVCLPSHWSPASKVGLRFTEIHAPVADSRMLRSRGEQLMQLVSAGEPWERFVWTLTPNPRLDAHPERVAHVAWPLDSDAEALARQTFLRTERQTFIPVPGHRQAIFTIHVEVSALADAVTTAEAAQHLHDGLASMSEAVLAYRRLAEPRDRLLAWLAAKAAA